MNEFYKLVQNLSITLEEDLEGGNTSVETVAEVDGRLKKLNDMWTEYKRVNKF